MTSMADIKRVFIDTSAWIDLMNTNERHHTAAVTFHKSLAPMTLRITNWGIVSETFTWIRYHIGDREAARWLTVKDAMENQGFLQIIYPDSADGSRSSQGDWSLSRSKTLLCGCFFHCIDPVATGY